MHPKQIDVAVKPVAWVHGVQKKNIGYIGFDEALAMAWLSQPSFSFSSGIIPIRSFGAVRCMLAFLSKMPSSELEGLGIIPAAAGVFWTCRNSAAAACYHWLYYASASAHGRQPRRLSESFSDPSLCLKIAIGSYSMYFDVHLIALMNPSEPVSETETERESAKAPISGSTKTSWNKLRLCSLNQIAFPQIKSYSCLRVMPCELCHMMASQRKCRLVCTSAEQRPPRNIIVICAYYFGSFFWGGWGIAINFLQDFQATPFRGGSLPLPLISPCSRGSVSWRPTTGGLGIVEDISCEPIFRTRSICSSHNLQTVNCL